MKSASDILNLRFPFDVRNFTLFNQANITIVSDTEQREVFLIRQVYYHYFS